MSCAVIPPIAHIKHMECKGSMPDFNLLFHPADVHMKIKNGVVIDLTVKRRGRYNGKYYNRPIVEFPLDGSMPKEQAMAIILSQRITDEPLCKTQSRHSMRLTLPPSKKTLPTTQL